MWINDWIPTLEKWKRGYELRIGDVIFNGEGNPTPILELRESVCTIKRINIEDGTYIDCHKGEFIKVGRRFSITKNKDNSEFINVNSHDNFSINNSLNVPLFYVYKCNIPKYVNQFLNIEPYVLGCLIGNAQLKRKDNEILVENIDKDGKIPEIYRTAPIDDRKMLLSGIMDTNGTFNSVRHMNSFRTNNPLLAIDIHELILSLGGTCYRTENSRSDMKYFLFFILPYPPFLQNNKEKNKWVYNKTKDYKTLNNIINLDKLETVIPIVKENEYLQGKWYITKKHG